MRTWLMRGTIHFARARGRALAAGAVRPARSRRRRSAAARSSGITTGRARAQRRAARRGAGGDRRLSRPEVAGAARGARASRRPAAAGTTSSSRLAHEGLDLHRAAGRASSRRSSCSTTGLREPRARELVARGGARRAGGALRREPRAGDRARPRALGGHHARRRARAACATPRRRSSCATLGRHRVLARRPSRRRRGHAAGRAPARRSCWPASTSTSSATRIATRSSPPSTPTGSCRAPTASSGRSIVVGGQIVGTWGRTRARRGADDHAPAVRARRPRARRAGAAGGRALPRVPRLPASRRRSSLVGRSSRAHGRRPVHARPARARPARARRRGRGGRARRAAVRASTARCSRASARPTASPSCSTRSRDLDASLRKRGGALVVREGDVVEQAMRVAARVAGRGDLPQRGRERLRAGAASSALRRGLRRGAAGAERPAGRHGDPARRPRARRRRLLPGLHAVLAALARSRRAARSCAAPRQLAVPGRLARGRLPALADLARGSGLAGAACAAASRRGGAGSRAGSRAVSRATTRLHDDLAADGTSRLSAYLHFGCLSPLELRRARERPGGRGAVRAPALLARLLRAAARGAPRDLARRLPPARRIAGATTRDGARGLEGRAAPAIRSSTPACGSSRARASCTTARGCSRPRS